MKQMLLIGSELWKEGPFVLILTKRWFCYLSRFKKNMIRKIIAKEINHMNKTGQLIEMTKGYNGVKGEIIDRTDSMFELYIIRLQNGINLVAGSSAFSVSDGE